MLVWITALIVVAPLVAADEAGRVLGLALRGFLANLDRSSPSEFEEAAAAGQDRRLGAAYFGFEVKNLDAFLQPALAA